MDANKYMTMFIGALVLVALVSATAGTLLTYFGNLSTAFSSTGISAIFGAGILGLIFAAGIFYALYKVFWSKK